MILDAQIPAYEGCIRCGKGDTTTAFGIRGSAAFVRDVLIRVGGWTEEEAMASIVRDLEAEGADLEEARDSMETCARLCPGCADAIGISVGEFEPSDFHHALPGLQEGG